MHGESDQHLPCRASGTVSRLNDHGLNTVNVIERVAKVLVLERVVVHDFVDSDT